MFNNTDSKAIRTEAALELGRYKISNQINGGSKYPSLSLADVNELMVVAGCPLVSANELDVMEFDPEGPEEDDSEGGEELG